MSKASYIEKLNGILYIERGGELSIIKELSDKNKRILAGDNFFQKQGTSVIILNGEKRVLNEDEKIINEKKPSLMESFNKLFEMGHTAFGEEPGAGFLKSIHCKVETTAIPMNNGKVHYTKPLFFIKDAQNRTFELQVKDSSGNFVYQATNVLSNQLIECTKSLDYEADYKLIVKDNEITLINNDFKIASHAEIEKLNKELEMLKYFNSGDSLIEETAIYLLANNYFYEAACYLLKESEKLPELTPNLLKILDKLGYPQNILR